MIGSYTLILPTKIVVGYNVTSHLNAFDALWSQVQAQKLIIDVELKIDILLCTLHASRDTFCIVDSNHALNGKLVYNDICGALLSEEICRKSMIALRNGNAYNVYEVGSHKHQQRNRSQKRNNRGNNRSRRESMNKNIKCHYFYKKGHRKIVMP